jgi:hypothetical protein
MSALANAVLVSGAGAEPRPAVLRPAPTEPVRAPARIGARLAEAGPQLGQAPDAKAPPPARTRLAATVRPAGQPDPTAWLNSGPAAFLAQRLAQEAMPEALDETPLRRRAGYAAYAAAGGNVAVLGPAYTGAGITI